MRGSKQMQGFTLLELMIVIAIIGTLVSIAYPSYSDHMKKTRRTDGQGNLVAFANAMERYYTESNTYLGAANGGGDTGAPASSVYPSQAPVDGGTKYYNLSILAATATSFTLAATPIAGGAQTGDGRLELDSTGVRRWNSADDGSGSDSNW